MKKIEVRYVGGMIGEPKKGQPWGGTMATNYTIKRAFENSKKYNLVMRPRSDFKNIKEVKEWLDGSPISWMDETSLLQQYFIEGYARPNLIGPISRSPVKRYNNGEWNAGYTPEWFYSGPVLRLNENEEKKIMYKQDIDNNVDYLKKTTFIRHGIDTEYLKPNNKGRKYILWAGNAGRDAKNYPMFADIKEAIRMKGGLPHGFEFRQMSGYPVDKFWDILDETAVYVVTSKYESFCCAANEARAKGVPTIVKDFLTGDYMFTDQPIQVPYDAVSFANKIIELCKGKDVLERESKNARKWVENNCSLDVMRKDIEKVFDKLYSDLKQKGDKKKSKKNDNKTKKG